MGVSIKMHHLVQNYRPKYFVPKLMQNIQAKYFAQNLNTGGLYLVMKPQPCPAGNEKFVRNTFQQRKYWMII